MPPTPFCAQRLQWWLTRRQYNTQKTRRQYNTQNTVTIIIVCWPGQFWIGSSMFDLHLWKMDPKWAKMDPKWCKMAPKWSLGRDRWAPGTSERTLADQVRGQGGSIVDSRASKGPKWCPKGFRKGTQKGSQMDQKRSKSVPNCCLISEPLVDRFWIVFETQIDPFWWQEWIKQNRNEQK